MKHRLIFCLFALIVPLQSMCSQAYIGPHFNYTRLCYDKGKSVDGYLAGVSTGTRCECGCFAVDVNFEGSWDTNCFSGHLCERASIEDYLLEIRMGPEILSCSNVLLYVYTGFGWNRLINDFYPDTLSLCFRYDKLFVPVGVNLCWYVASWLTSGIELEWRPDVYSVLHIDSFKIDLACEHALRVQLPLNFFPATRCPNLTVSVVPFSTWNWYGKVKKEEDRLFFKIPSLKRWDLGLRLLFGLNF